MLAPTLFEKNCCLAPRKIEKSRKALTLTLRCHMIMHHPLLIWILFCFLGLLDGYERLCTACLHLAPVLAELEHEHLCRFSLTWEVLNKYLHQSIIYSDPIIQANVPIFISQVSVFLWVCVCKCTFFLLHCFSEALEEGPLYLKLIQVVLKFWKLFIFF